MNKLLLLTLVASITATTSNPESAVISRRAPATVECPKIQVTCSDPFDEKTPLTFQVHVQGVDPNKKLKYSWFVSQGRVKSGQNTSSIVVDSTGTVRQGLTATVVICGLPDECENEASCTTAIAKMPKPGAPNNSLEPERRRHVSHQTWCGEG
jgi:hypothetical protein